MWIDSQPMREVMQDVEQRWIDRPLGAVAMVAQQVTEAGNRAGIELRPEPIRGTQRLTRVSVEQRQGARSLARRQRTGDTAQRRRCNRGEGHDADCAHKKLTPPEIANAVLN